MPMAFAAFDLLSGKQNMCSLQGELKFIILDKITHTWQNKFVIIIGISKTRYIRTGTYLRFSKLSFFA